MKRYILNLAEVSLVILVAFGIVAAMLAMVLVACGPFLLADEGSDLWLLAYVAYIFIAPLFMRNAGK